MAQWLPLLENGSEKETLAFATACDTADPLKHLREEFLIPSKNDLPSGNTAKQGALDDVGKGVLDSSSQDPDRDGDKPCIYLCGNSLGLQPRRTARMVQEHLSIWASKGVYGHFTETQGSSLSRWIDVDDDAAKLMAPVVGAAPSEVAVMETLTANLHLMMASFYLPTKTRYKIILEGKAFPSDHYAVHSQVQHHGYDPVDAMVMLKSEDLESPTLNTADILEAIDKYAHNAALILLPGIQYFTGQLFDIKTITQRAHLHSIPIGWDLAHAAGNVELRLHDWDVDFAVWCNYKYLNSGPGAIASLFLHEKHGQVDLDAVKTGKGGFRKRFAGWWGGDKNARFQMTDRFVPTPGAAGFQLGNPCALALVAVRASLEVFALTSMLDIRQKSMYLTSYLEHLLDAGEKKFYRILTPRNSAERGAQLSIRVRPESMESILISLAMGGVVVDERKPDVIRVAPAPLYNTFADVFNFVRIFKEAGSNAKTLE